MFPRRTSKGNGPKGDRKGRGGEGSHPLQEEEEESTAQPFWAGWETARDQSHEDQAPS